MYTISAPKCSTPDMPVTYPTLRQGPVSLPNQLHKPTNTSTDTMEIETPSTGPYERDVIALPLPIIILLALLAAWLLEPDDELEEMLDEIENRINGN